MRIGRKQYVNYLGSFIRPESVLSIISQRFDSFYFQDNGCNWTVEKYRKELINYGALESLATIEWVENHYNLIIFKIACMLRFFPGFLSQYWNAEHILKQLRFRLVKLFYV